MHLSRHLKIASVAIIGCLGVGACVAAAYSWYDERYAWPRRIQIEILGEEIVTYSTWMKHCPSQVVEGCEFTKFAKPEDLVETSVSYKNGLVTIEEWWM